MGYRHLGGVACNFLDIMLFLTLSFQKIMEAKSKLMGCWVR